MYLSEYVQSALPAILGNPTGIIPVTHMHLGSWIRASRQRVALLGILGPQDLSFFFKKNHGLKPTPHTKPQGLQLLLNPSFCRDRACATPATTIPNHPPFITGSLTTNPSNRKMLSATKDAVYGKKHLEVGNQSLRINGRFYFANTRGWEERL